jgi:hypothetical protein
VAKWKAKVPHRDAVAYHEAGHVVAAHALGMPAPAYVSIIPDGLTAGHVRERPLPPVSNEIKESLMNVARSLPRLVTLFAGPIAQIRYDPASWNPVNGSGDWYIACRMVILLDRIIGMGRERRRTLLIGAAMEAGFVVEKNWPLIEGIARALLDRHWLTGDEIVAVLRSCQSSARPVDNLR